MMKNNLTLAPIDRLLAEQACRDLVILAAVLVDVQAFEGYAALFTRDGVLLRPGLQAIQGYAAILDSYRSKPAGRITRHLLSNTLVVLESDSQARATSNVLLWSGRMPDPAGPFGRPLRGQQVVGEFEDRFFLTSEGWRFQRREARFVLFKDEGT
jgi:hypothetical protein